MQPIETKKNFFISMRGLAAYNGQESPINMHRETADCTCRRSISGGGRSKESLNKKHTMAKQQSVNGCVNEVLCLLWVVESLDGSAMPRRRCPIFNYFLTCEVVSAFGLINHVTHLAAMQLFTFHVPLL